MRQTWKPILALIVLAPFLAEVLSGATPFTAFANPAITLSYIVFLYGLQVLVLREIAVRKSYGPLGLWCLGLIYGIYNEGLRTESLFHPLESPMEEFHNYGLVGGIRVPFALWIVLWHALFSVVTPVLLVQRAFPALAPRPWLPVKATWALGILSAGSGVAYFLWLGEDRLAESGTRLILHLGVMLGASAAFWLAAWWLRRPAAVDEKASRVWPLLCGAAGYLVVFLAAELLALMGTPWSLFVLYLIIVVVASVWLIARRRHVSRDAAVLFVLGSALAQAFLSVVFGAVTGNVLWAVAGAGFAVAFVFAAWRVAW